MTRYADHVSTRQTPQSEQADPAQVENSAGGFTFALDMWGALDRWLILGSEGGTFYTRERKLTKERAKTIAACLDADPVRTLSVIVETSQSGRAPKNDPAIFALAMASAHPDKTVRAAAMLALPLVCRTGTHLFQFAQSVEAFRGWGRSLRRGIGAWYTGKDAEKLAYQLAKYRQRGGWSHRDLLRLAHVKSDDKAVNALLRWAVGASFEERAVKRTAPKKAATYPSINGTVLPRIVEGFAKAQACTDKFETAKLVREYGLTHEMLPSEMLAHAVVWEALLGSMPMTAMIRNLARMTSLGLIKPLGSATDLVVRALGDAERLKKARVHPLALLTALKTYESGKGMRGSLTWTPVAQVCDALDEAFYLSFDNVVPSGKNTMLALDVSGSMDFHNVAGMPLTPRVASAAMAMVTARTEPNYMVAAFASGTVPNRYPGYGFGRGGDGITALDITPKMRLDDVLAKVSDLPFGGTDCSLPMTYALEHKLPIDTFVVYTDNETWAGNIHPHQALVRYRQATGRNAKLIVVGMTATDFTIADPSDAGMLDVVGFNTSAPRVMADFARE